MIGVATQPIASIMNMMNARFETPSHPFRRYCGQAALLIAALLPALAMAQAAPASGSVVTTASGLVFKLIQQGKGPSPTASDTVKVHYRGTLMDGKEFDSSYKRGQPATFGVSGVIKGWTEALQLMNAGSKWELYIPPDLAYGEQGRPNIPPNSLLVFEVELLTNAPPAPPAAPAAPLTSDIIKVPSAEEMKKGAKIETIKAEDIEKEIQKQKQAQPKPADAAK